MTEKTVFISYRRDAAGKALARSIEQALTHRGYDAFLDVDDIDAGPCAPQLFQEITKRAHFLLILTPGSLGPCANPNDWVRREFQYASESGRNIVPVVEESVDLKRIQESCDPSMTSLFDYQAVIVRHADFDVHIETLLSRFISKHHAPVTPARKADDLPRTPPVKPKIWKYTVPAGAIGASTTMKSAALGLNTSLVEVTNISRHGFWLLIENEELFLPFADFPWFKDTAVGKILNVERPSSNHLYWPDLDVDVADNSIRYPEKLPLVGKINT